MANVVAGAGVCYVGGLWQGGRPLSCWLPRPAPPLWLWGVVMN